MIGNGADDVYYSSSKRFQYGSVGIGLPIFSGAQKAKITASKLNENLAEQNYLLGVQNMQNSYQSALVNYKSQLESLNYFEDLALKNAELIKETATKQFETGEINYLTWVILINQSITIQNEYLEAVNNLNQSTIQLNFLIEN
jgi:cobalt-zinc-cadmium resistance protein CzcA